MVAISRMVDLEMDDEETFDLPAPLKSIALKYPPELRIALRDRTLDKCGLDCGDFKKDDEVEVKCCGIVTEVSDGQGGRRVEIQITHIEVEEEGEGEAEEMEED